MSQSNIGWTEETWNPVTGCSHVSAGCVNCYAETLSLRRGWSQKPWTAQNASDNVRLHPNRVTAPLHWKKPRLVFVNSMSDLFHELVPDAFIDGVFAVMAATQGQHTYQVLTKRAKRMRDYVSGLGRDYDRLGSAARSVGYTLRFQGIPLVQWPLPNVWLGVSVEDQKNTDERIPLLLQTPAAVRFISAEPLLGPIDLSVRYFALLNGGEYPFPNLAPEHQTSVCELLDWVIAGGESGPDHRPMDVEWATELRDQCHQYGVPFFMKQDSGARPGMQGRLSDDLWSYKQMPERQTVPA